MSRVSGGLLCATLLALVGLPIGLSAFGCSTADTGSGFGVAPSVGSIGLTLQANGVTLNSVSYTILGTGFSQSGSINIANSTQISAVIGNIPAGDGYSITLNASDASNALITCTGSASFDIAAGATTTALVRLQCRMPAKTGGVLVNGTVNVCPVIDALSVMPTETTVGNSLSLLASAGDVDHLPGPLSYLWSASGGSLSGATTASAALVCTNVGLLTVTLSVSDGDCSDTLTQTVVCSAEPGGSAGAGGAPSAGAGGAVSGGAGGALSSGGSGGAAGGVGGATAGSAGRAGTGGSAAGTAGAAGSGGAPGAFKVWPGGTGVVTVDVANTFPSNLSGLLFEPGQSGNPDVLWGVQNGPSKLYRLLWNGTLWTADTAKGWSDGKTLSYTTGLGAPDSEGVTKAAFGTNPLYVSTERDNDNNALSRLSVLMFDGNSASSTISAVKDWDLTADLPVAGANLGLEAIAWVPDAYLVSKGFIDESKNLPYDPASYADHAGGIFFVGLEQNGMIYGYALDHAGGGFTRVASVVSGNPSIMDLNFDRDVGYLWAACDNTCAGRTTVLDVDTRVGSLTLGKFYIRQGFERPSAMPDTNNEGFTVTPESTCAGGFKSVFYADDNDLNGHAIRRGSIPCGVFL